jgi:CHAT domain-containing protein
MRGLLVILLLPFAAHAAEPADVARRAFEAVAAGDAAAAHSLSVGGVEVVRLNALLAASRVRCMRVASFHIDDEQISGDHAEVRATAAMGKLDPVDGREVVDLEHAIFGFKRAGDRWLLASWTNEEENLGEAIGGAKSDAEAVSMVMARPELFDEALTRSLRRRGNGFVNRQDMEKAGRISAAFLAFAAATRDDVVTANAFGLAAVMVTRRDKPESHEAVRLAEEALASARRSGDPDTIGLQLYTLARAHQWHDGNLSQGGPLLEEAFRLHARYIDESIAQRAAMLLCARFVDRGEYRNCFPYIAVARDIALRTNDVLGLFTVELVLGDVFLGEHDLALSMVHYEKARDLADQVHFPGAVGAERGVALCALLLGREKEFHAAVDDLFRRPHDVNPSMLIQAWTDIASDALRRKQIDEADRAAQQAVTGAKDASEDLVKAAAYETRARVRIAQKRWTEALEAAQQAIGFVTKGGSVNQLSPWVIAARAHLALHDRAAAYASLHEALRYGEIERAEAGGTARQIALLFEPAAEAYSMLVDLLVEDGRVNEALLVAERAKSRTLLDILDGTRSNAEADVPPATLTEEQKREKELLDANIAGNRKRIQKARLELETFRAILDANRPRLRASRGAGTLASVASLRPLLPDDRSAIVEYVIGENRLHIFMIRRSGVIVRSVPMARGTLGRLVDHFSGAVGSQDVAYAADARRLYKLLLAPVLRAAPRVREVAIVPDGALWHVPFDALMDEQGAFAVEKRTFFYAPSAAVLLREHERRIRVAAGTPFFLGFGNPRIETASNDPEAAREVKTIARIVEPRTSRVFTGADALESRAKAEAPHFRVIHLATHGVLDDQNPMYSRLLLSRRDGDGEDGVLEAREMLDLDLRSDLVVLSACDTARGGVHAGEGLLGMSWALFAAGTPSVIASQWRVGSARTEELMVAFYHHWMKQPAEPFAKARALRAARLGLMRDPAYRHPYYWSPFILIGAAD